MSRIERRWALPRAADGIARGTRPGALAMLQEEAALDEARALADEYDERWANEVLGNALQALGHESEAARILTMAPAPSDMTDVAPEDVDD